ncbi:sensor histidine kinase [Zooshikella ganghwensis]|uniref:sensor histidine kinase n=1 Tax=Zooshikella ganghwensis TaxID=202772 RepID=UPI002D805DC2|nr:ATP-binding protein [Zooshikella ganghwensis]
MTGRVERQRQATHYKAVSSGAMSMAEVAKAESSAFAAALQDVQSSVDDKTGLEKAFSLFNQMSEQLSESYRQLAGRVQALKSELADVGEQRLQELAEKERLANRLEHLLNLLPGGVIVLDGHGVIQQCNPAAIELLDEPLLGERWLTVINRCFAPRDDDGHEISLKNGKRVSIATRSLELEPGQLILLTDLTETRCLQQQLSHHERLSALGKMVASLAHQIRTPLSTAMLYAGHLQNPALPREKHCAFANKLMSRLTHLERQVSDMLVFAKGELVLADTIAIKAFWQELQQAVESAMGVRQVSTGQVNLRWRYQLEQTFLIRCNKDALIGALMNLVNNALESGKKGLTLVISCSLYQHYLRLTVVDNGPGMSAKTLAQTQEPFFTTKPHGTGLGIAVVQAVTKAHQGEFAMHSREGQGTVCQLLLPLNVAAISADQSEEEAAWPR